MQLKQDWCKFSAQCSFDLFYWFLLCFYAFLLYFPYFEIFGIKNVFRQFCFLPKFHDFLLFSVSRKMGDSTLDAPVFVSNQAQGQATHTVTHTHTQSMIPSLFTAHIFPFVSLVYILLCLGYSITIRTPQLWTYTTSLYTHIATIPYHNLCKVISKWYWIFQLKILNFILNNIIYRFTEHYKSVKLWTCIVSNCMITHVDVVKFCIFMMLMDVNKSQFHWVPIQYICHTFPSKPICYRFPGWLGHGHGDPKVNLYEEKKSRSREI